MQDQGQQLALFSCMPAPSDPTWTRAGKVLLRPDGSLEVRLDELPLDDRLHVGDTGEAAEHNA
jgi:hypothetical protein